MAASVDELARWAARVAWAYGAPQQTQMERLAAWLRAMSAMHDRIRFSPRPPARRGEAAGRFRATPDPRALIDGTFAPGRTWRVLVQHRVLARSAQGLATTTWLRWCDPKTEAPRWDLVLTSGPRARFGSAGELLEARALTVIGSARRHRRYLELHPRSREALIGSVSPWPCGFGSTNLVGEFTHRVSRGPLPARWARFRLVPMRPRLVMASGGEAPAEVFERAVPTGDVAYRLEVQHRPVGSARVDRDGQVPWDADEYPWFSLGQLRLEEVLPSDSGCWDGFGGVAPASLSPLQQDDLSDPSSYAALYAHAAELVARWSQWGAEALEGSPLPLHSEALEPVSSTASDLPAMSPPQLMRAYMGLSDEDRRRISTAVRATLGAEHDSPGVAPTESSRPLVVPPRIGGRDDWVRVEGASMWDEADAADTQTPSPKRKFPRFWKPSKRS